MDPDQQTKTTGDVDINSETSGSLSRMATDESTTIDVKEIGEKLRDFVEVFPQQFSETVEIYKKPLTTAAIILGALVSVAVADGVLDVLNALPLLAPLLELVGLGYTAWFAWHYLRYAESRRKLAEDYRHLKEQIMGKND